jgi:hypothetical protein
MLSTGCATRKWREHHDEGRRIFHCPQDGQAKAHTGRVGHHAHRAVWKNLMEKMRAEAHEATLRAKITGSQEEVRAGVQAYMNAFHATFGAAAAEEAGKRQLVQNLIKNLDKDVAPFAPGTEKLVKELAATICEAVKCTEQICKKKPGAPTMPKTTPSTGGGGEERSPVRGNCYKCGEPGHLKRDCRNKSKAKPGAPKTSEQEPKRDVQCATCAAENDHYTRQCEDVPGVQREGPRPATRRKEGRE